VNRKHLKPGPCNSALYADIFVNFLLVCNALKLVRTGTGAKTPEL